MKNRILSSILLAGILLSSFNSCSETPAETESEEEKNEVGWWGQPGNARRGASGGRWQGEQLGDTQRSSLSKQIPHRK